MPATRPAKTIAVANMKGGVGKTTVVVSLAETLALRARARVLVIDLDPQANASFCLAGDAVLLDLIQAGRTVDAFLEDRIIFNQDRSLADLVQHDVGAVQAGPSSGVSLIACSPDLRIVERETLVFLARGDLALFDIERRVSEIFRSELDALKDAFDFIIIDCPPGISPITEAALWASDQIIVPTVPDLICNLGLEAFCQTVTLSDAENGAPRRRPWVLANRVRRTRSQINILEEMRSESRSENAGFLMFETEIPDCPDLQEATNWTGERTPYPAKYGQETAAVLDRLVNEM